MQIIRQSHLYVGQPFILKQRADGFLHMLSEQNFCQNVDIILVPLFDSPFECCSIWCSACLHVVLSTRGIVMIYTIVIVYYFAENCK